MVMTDPFCNFYIGQKIVCIQPCNLNSSQVAWPNKPVVGGAYHVRGLFVDPFGPRIGVLLREIVNPTCNFLDGVKEGGFWHGHFRPATDISSLEKLLITQPEDELVL
jgi:hypothetical protein